MAKKTKNRIRQSNINSFNPSSALTKTEAAVVARQRGTPPLTEDDLGRIVYSAYWMAVGGVSFSGERLPSWSEMRLNPATLKVRQGWIAGALAVRAV